ncbi:MAG: transketolase [Myxococcales bacterium]|nr:transketolase [Myxococcales bacterium]MDH3482713.1 transketolase [Myxococcales bacterium]
MGNPGQLDALAIKTIRGLSMDAVQAASSGHPGTPMALAPLGWALFSELRRHDPGDPDWPDRDRFVLSCGHASMLQYALLHLTGYAVSLDDIRHFRQWGSLTPGHPESHLTPGVETTTGPLGQGFGNAVGMAMAERHLAARFNRPGHAIVDHRTWVIASDGDIMEGVASEAASIAGHLRLGKLVVFWDDNRITIDGSTDLCFSEDVLKRFESYGWHTESVEDGEDLEALKRTAEVAVADDRPSFIRVRTIIGYPSPNKSNSSAAHGAPLGEDEIIATKQLMEWPTDTFFVPDELAAAAEDIRERGAKSRSAWRRRFDAYRGQFPEEARAFDEAIAGELPAAWDRDLPVFEADPKGLATRKASGQVLNVLASRLEGLMGGSADLAGSNNSTIKGHSTFLADAVGIPRNMDWGIREHGMASALNGMALHGGVIPFGATFLIFSDYMRPAIRLAALMGLHTRYIFTHDSIGLGEDGPTHQPVEQLASLRAIPGLAVLRPADANEVRECWKAAIEWDGPAALALTRQGVPTLDRGDLASAEKAKRGAYILREAGGGGPDVILVATGSEVAIALGAAEALEAEGASVRVVSMPCWELFAQQGEDYQREVLPKETPKVVVEAGIRQGWDRWVGNDAAFVTVEKFGASAPYKVLFEKYGLTAENVAAQAKRLLS